MGRLSSKREAQARAGRTSLAARRARETLLVRGVSITLRELGRRSLAECIDANNWARNRRPLGLRPAWIGELLAQKRARLLAGVCAACGCTERRGCPPFGCCWTTPARTLCSGCDDTPDFLLLLIGPEP